MNNKWVKNIDFDLPDLLSIFRIFFAIVFVVLAVRDERSIFPGYF